MSIAGSAVTLVALPVLVYDLTRSPLLTGLVAGLEGLPYLAFGLAAGALADRVDRCRLMITADLLGVVVLGSVPVAWGLDALTVGHLLAVAALAPTLFVFFDAANFGALPTLVGRARLPAANSAVWGAATVAEVAVPPLAGLLLAVADAAVLLAVDALSFLASALLLRAITRPLTDPARDRPRFAERGMLGDIREGLAWLWRQATVRAMTVVGATQAFAGGAFIGQLVVWADQELQVRAGDGRLGLLFGAWGAGGLLAALAMPRLAARAGPARVWLRTLPVSALLAVAAVLAPHWVLAAAALFAWAVAFNLVVMNSITYRQQATPEPLMSRVNTTGRMLSWGLGAPLGAVVAGALAEAYGARVGMLAGCGALAAGTAYALLVVRTRLP